MGRLFLVIGLCIVGLLFLPINLRTEVYYDVNGRKCAFSINVYRIIKLMGGYIATYRGGLAFHLSKNKAILLPYSEMDKERKRLSIFHAFRLKSLHLTTEVGAEYLFAFTALHTLFKTYATIGNKKGLKSNLWVTDGNVLRVSLCASIYFNLFIILYNIIRHWKEEIKLLCQTKT